MLKTKFIVVFDKKGKDDIEVAINTAISTLRWQSQYVFQDICFGEYKTCLGAKQSFIEGEILLLDCKKQSINDFNSISKSFLNILKDLLELDDVGYKAECDQQSLLISA